MASIDQAELVHVVRAGDAGAPGADGLVDYVSRHREPLGVRLLEHGAILLRGFEIDTVEAFTAVVRAFSGSDRMFDYTGGASPRRALGQGSYSSTEYPPHLTLPLHNELSYAGRYPRRLFFCCLVEPESGGETTLGDSRRILARIDAGVADVFRRRHVRYIRNLSGASGSGYAWQDAFETEDRGEAERRCREIGAEFEWLPSGVLHMSQVRPATAVHPETGQEVWFNQADGFHPSVMDAATYAALVAESGGEDRLRLSATYGDGTPIDPAALEHVREVIRAQARPHAWRRGDVLVLDNMLAAHGRLPFVGPRRIALAMT